MEKGHLAGWVTLLFLVYKSNEFEYIDAWDIGEISVLWLLSVIQNGLSKFGESIHNSINKVRIESWTYFFSISDETSLGSCIYSLDPFSSLLHSYAMIPFTYFKFLKACFIYFSNNWQYFECVWFWVCDSVI